MQLNSQTIKKYQDESTQAPCISIYTPTQPSSTSQTINEDRIRYKNALQEIDAAIKEHPDLKKTHRELQQLADNVDFWLHQGLGLAIFANSKGFETVKLPYELTPVAEVGNKYAISPLLIMNSMNRDYFFLDVNFKQPQLYSGSAYGLAAVDSVELPGEISEVLDTTELRQSTVSMRGSASGGSVFYGYAEIDKAHANEATQYLRLVAAEVNKFLTGQTAPLLISGSPKVVAEIADYIQYGHIVEDSPVADYDAQRETNLHTSAQQIISSHAKKEQRAIVDQFEGTDTELRADGLVACQTAAEQGKLDSLLLPIVRTTTDGVQTKAEAAPLVELPNNFSEFEKMVVAAHSQSANIIPIEQSYFSSDPTPKAILRY